MNPSIIVAIAATSIVVIAAFLSFNRFISQRQLMANAWSNVDTELRRRYDLIPNLVSTVSGYATHERETLTAVMDARASAVSNHGSANEQSESENVLVEGLRGLLAVSERYPDLKASKHFLDLQRQLVTTEDRIQANRRIYNGNVRSYNRRVESIPSNLVALIARFKRAEYFEVDPALRTEDVVGVSASFDAFAD
jgi:LemA protein